MRQLNCVEILKLFSLYYLIAGSAAQSESHGISSNRFISQSTDAGYESSDWKMASDFLLGGQLDIMTEISQTCQSFQGINTYL